LTKIYTVVHQTGPNHKCGENSDRYKPTPYISKEMPDVLAAAELVLCRSGAGTVWECAIQGKPMLLVPLTGSGTRGDQVENARFFEKSGAAQVLLGEDVNPQTLIRIVEDLADNIIKRETMAAASLKIGGFEGTGLIAQFLKEKIMECEI
jgi:UDP-N-acetylglucosamine--N-acetylmuramyl-(pentapeptide) pyrophosphoryl-undecaprenol N-acetylglucosamine transferase